jgi:hypothetical protein
LDAPCTTPLARILHQQQLLLAFGFPDCALGSLAYLFRASAVNWLPPNNSFKPTPLRGAA